MSNFRSFFLCLLGATALITGCTSLMGPEYVSLQENWEGRSEIKRLRWFSEVGAPKALATGLTGKGVRVTILGEMVDPRHPDLAGAVKGQYNAFARPGQIVRGTGNLPYKAELMSAGDGHGTHIAGTITAACDGLGVQGLACNATLDVYDIGAYDNAGDWMPGASEEDIFGGFINAYAASLRDVTARGESRITTGSFNLESPAIRFRESSKFKGKTLTEMVKIVLGDLGGADDLFDGGYAVPEDPSDRAFLERMIKKNEGDDLIALSSAVVLTQDWTDLEVAIAAYQAKDGVYLVTESNYTFEDHSSTLNAMPSLSDKVDPDLWLSVVMVVPQDMDKLNEFETQDGIEKYLKTAAYTTPINSCGAMAADYCIVTPSYIVLSTMTESIAQPGEPIFMMDGRTYQSFDGHSMGAPMVAAALALMEEENLRMGYGYTMKDLVSILKTNANRTFSRYNRIQHGVGMLDVSAAISGMKK